MNTPHLVTVERDGDTFIVLADGVPVLTLPRGKALWLNARLAERLAERVALPDGNPFTG